MLDERERTIREAIEAAKRRAEGRRFSPRRELIAQARQGGRARAAQQQEVGAPPG
jgi:hypothetical protein